ncbi:hypothetical protein [Desulfosporosinus sp.]
MITIDQVYDCILYGANIETQKSWQRYQGDISTSYRRYSLLLCCSCR